MLRRKGAPWPELGCFMAFQGNTEKRIFFWGA